MQVINHKVSQISEMQCQLFKVNQEAGVFHCRGQPPHINGCDVKRAWATRVSYRSRNLVNTRLAHLPLDFYVLPNITHSAGRRKPPVLLDSIIY